MCGPQPGANHMQSNPRELHQAFNNNGCFIATPHDTIFCGIAINKPTGRAMFRQKPIQVRSGRVGLCRVHGDTTVPESSRLGSLQTRLVTLPSRQGRIKHFPNRPWTQWPLSSVGLCLLSSCIGTHAVHLPHEPEMCFDLDSLYPVATHQFLRLEFVDHMQQTCPIHMLKTVLFHFRLQLCLVCHMHMPPLASRLFY